MTSAAPNAARVALIDSGLSSAVPPGPNAVSGANLVRTTFAAGAPDLATGAAPYTGTFHPVGDLATLNGGPANGVWQLEVTSCE